MTRAGLYRMKPAWQRLLQPLADRLVARHISADLLTATALLAAGVAGACLAVSDTMPALLLLVPILAALRLVLNLLDGQVARGSGTARPMGEVWNELADRVADVLMIGALAFVAAVGPLLAGAATVAALLASYVGITSRAVGAPRQYGGVMSKPGRMIVLATAAPLALLLADGRPLMLGALVIAGGALVTSVQRLVATVRDLSGVVD
jgi:CDP-diacylglycerol--glycerol-3-phosphate 3-phosphatidyltransferase